MTRLLVFLSVLVGFVIILTFSTYKNLPVSNEKFDYQKSAEAFHAHTELIKNITPVAQQILDLSFDLSPFLPETAEKIKKIFTKEKIVSIEPLFPRI